MCIINLDKECKEEKKSCDKFVNAYHIVCDLIRPYIELAYNKNYDELNTKISELDYFQIEELNEQAELCLFMRRFHQNQCINTRCHDKGHNKQIALVYQVLSNVRNKMIQIEHDRLAELYLNDDPDRARRRPNIIRSI